MALNQNAALGAAGGWQKEDSLAGRHVKAGWG